VPSDLASVGSIGVPLAGGYERGATAGVLLEPHPAASSATNARGASATTDRRNHRIRVNVAHRTRLGRMDDLGQPGQFPPSPEQSMSGYYGGSVRTALRLVRAVPRGWPPPLRITAQIPVALVGAAMVLVAWVLTTVVVLASNAGGALGRSGPRY
jgi:hypothetical protein